MLTFYYGTELEKLADQLFEELGNHPLEDLLAKEIFVVQNHGLGQWLSLRMAKKKGIAANLEFEFPSERIWSVIRQQNDDIPETLPSDRGPMTWTFMELFKEEQFLDEFENLRHYIAEENSMQRAMRSWKLASKIADVFDQYLIYRPEMILKWEKRTLHTRNIEAEKWQSQLWRRLVEYWKNNYEGDYLHRAQLQQELWNTLDQDNFDPSELPERISVFGVSSASPAFIKTMVKLSEITDVYFYQLSIDPNLTESNEFRNPLLQSLGDEGTNFMAMFRDVTDVEFKFVGGTDSSKHTLFSAVQSDLKKDHIKPADSSQSISADSTIQVHNCHSPMRECEVLYDQLLYLLDNNPDLSPDDILIMTPDIERYAPVIEAVFGRPDEGQPEIPYAIADRGVQGNNPATETFLSILELCDSRFKVTDVLDLLDAKPIQEAFAFNDEDLNRIEQWVGDNRVRWGIDGSNKQEIGLPDSDHFTWQAGLRRILLGYMMRPDEDRLHKGIFAYNEVESSKDADLAGRLSAFLNQLFEINRAVRHPKKPFEWERILGTIVDYFLPHSRDYFWEISKIREGISALTEQSKLGGFDRPISFSIIRRWLAEQLQSRSTGGGRIGRGVTFSSLMPMRSIPFNVIGMIGMNEGEFPQSRIPIEFDMMHLDTQTGDPVPSEQQRYLFLENLISARTHLYFSYVGQSNRQDADFPSSVVLKEFLDYLENYYGIKPDNLTTRHRLQAFSQTYFTDENYFSYSDARKKISQQLDSTDNSEESFFEKSLPEPDKEWRQLSVKDLIAFFRHPTKYLLQNRLGIYLRDENVLTDDREPFELDNLSGYHVKQELLDRFLKKKSLEDYRKVMQSRDMLPEGWSGKQEYQQKSSEVRAFGEEIQLRLDDQQLSDVEVDLEINGYRIVGKLNNIYRSSQMNYRFGKAKPKYVVDFWIRHLIFQQVKPNNHPGKSVYYSWDDGSFDELNLSSMADTEPILAELLDRYWQGLQSPLLLYCRSSYAFAEAVCDKESDIEEALSEAEKEWDPSWDGAVAEKGDDYYKLVTNGNNPFDEKFRETALKLWAPYFEVLNQEGR